MKGWSKQRYACSCGYEGCFKRVHNPYCPKCHSPPVRKVAMKVPEGYKSPQRKFKRRCAECGVSCIGFYCRKHTYTNPEARSSWLHKIRLSLFKTRRSQLLKAKPFLSNQMESAISYDFYAEKSERLEKSDGWPTIEEYKRNFLECYS